MYRSGRKSMFREEVCILFTAPPVITHCNVLFAVLCAVCGGAGAPVHPGEGGEAMAQALSYDAGEEEAAGGAPEAGAEVRADCPPSSIGDTLHRTPRNLYNDRHWRLRTWTFTRSPGKQHCAPGFSSLASLRSCIDHRTRTLISESYVHVWRCVYCITFQSLYYIGSV